MSRLLYFATVSHPELLQEALILFKHFIPHPNLYIYNLMISAFSFSSSQAIGFYKLMLLSESAFPDEHTLLALLKSPKRLSTGKQIHAHVVINGFDSHVYIQNSLIKMYFEVGEISLARMVFRYMSKHDVVSYNIMLSGYARRRLISEAIELFREMASSGTEPDQYTMVALLMCTGNLKCLLIGKAVHGFIIRRMSLGGWGLIVSNAILDMYAKCEEMNIARKLFYGFYEKDDVSWNTIISGFANIGELELASKFFSEAPRSDLISWNSLLAGYARKKDLTTIMRLFDDLLAQNIKPDKVTFIALVGTATETGVLNHGRTIHGWVVKAYGLEDAILGSALINMYSKCGKIECSHVVFEKVADKDITVWTAMIAGLAFHGHGLKSIELFREMEKQGLVPNSVTLIAALTACAHSGLVDTGNIIFENMREIYKFEPGVEHYGCMVDLLSRSGRLFEAVDLIKKMPMKPTRSVWGSILSASKAYQNTDLAEAASKALLELEPDEEVGYILLSNVYASCEQWSDCDKIREIMERKGVKKAAGCSSVVVDGVVHEFISSDKRHHKWGEISCVLCDLHRLMKVDAEVGFDIFRQFSAPDSD
uniref:Pentatricopeptide repeat-containing protein n=1 Tax=Ananas comosus var. bracteatus TaxID=296719 RepID=A0A6V7NV55_ANACO|nr:unnamed protein product [Ananas comosus var. bracteatus]